MSVVAERNIWIPSRVPKTLQCSECNRSCVFIAFQEPDHYEYRCSSCGATRLLTLPQINAMEASRLRKSPLNIPPVITHLHADVKR